MALMLATMAGACGFVIGDLFASARPGFSPAAGWSIWERRFVIIALAASLFIPAVLLEFYGAALADRIASALRRLRACARKRWKGERTREEFQRAEAGVGISVVVVLCIATLLFMPLPAFTILIACAALFMHGGMIVSVCRHAGFRPVRAALIPASYGAIVGYLVG